MRKLDADRRAWLAQLYDEHADRVFRYAASRCGRDVALEIVAETFAEAVRTNRRYDTERGTPGAWLLGIATNRIRRRGGAEHDLRAPERAALDARLADLPARLDAERLAPALREALAGLPPGERTAFLLFAVAELPPTDVAAALEISPGAARVRLHRARARLREALEPLVAQESAR